MFLPEVEDAEGLMTNCPPYSSVDENEDEVPPINELNSLR
jgi:hypothetical protein